MKTVVVIGAGTMGHGIGQVAAMAGYETRVTDAQAAALETAAARVRRNLEGGVARGKITQTEAAATQSRLTFEPALERAVAGADLIIEAVIEDLDVKRSVFDQVDAIAPPQAIFATNTSSLSVQALASATARPDRVIGMHFFNPVHIMKLVEIVRHDRVDPSVVDAVLAVATDMGKEPIVVADVPGFASSRLGVVLGLEAMRMVEQGVALPRDIDKALELGYGHPMGPLRVSDLVGLDVRLAIADYLHQELQEPHYAAPAILREKVAAGHLGKKTGQGFYEWPTPRSS